jgi:hypothetical protein
LGERPVSIVYFERAVLLSILLGLLNTYLMWDRIVAQIADLGYGPGFVVAVQIISYGVLLLLLWLIAYRRSNVARWTYVVLAALGLVSGLTGIREMLALDPLFLAISAVQYLISIVSIVLLFRPDARRWFDKNHAPVDADVFR